MSLTRKEFETYVANIRAKNDPEDAALLELCDKVGMLRDRINLLKVTGRILDTPDHLDRKPDDA